MALIFPPVPLEIPYYAGVPESERPVFKYRANAATGSAFADSVDEHNRRRVATAHRMRIDDLQADADRLRGELSDDVAEDSAPSDPSMLPTWRKWRKALHDLNEARTDAAGGPEPYADDDEMWDARAAMLDGVLVSVTVGRDVTAWPSSRERQREHLREMPVIAVEQLIASIAAQRYSERALGKS